MIELTYTVYGYDGKVIKSGVVTHKMDKDPIGPVNFIKVVMDYVGEDFFENEVAGIKD